jgi:hypothetical protein
MCRVFTLVFWSTVKAPRDRDISAVSVLYVLALAIFLCFSLFYYMIYHGVEFLLNLDYYQ